MRALKEQVMALGTSLEAALLDEVVYRIVVDHEGKIKAANTLFLDKTLWSMEALQHLSVYHHIIEPLIDEKTIENAQHWQPLNAWKGLFRVRKKNNQHFVVFGHQIPCTGIDGHLEQCTLLLYPADAILSAVPVNRKKQAEVNTLPPVNDNVRFLEIKNKRKISNTVQWIKQLQDQLQQEEGRFYTIMLTNRSVLPDSFFVDASFIEVIMPQMVRLSAALTSYGIIHIVLEVVMLRAEKKALRFHLEDTGEPLLTPDGVPNVATISTSELTRLEQLKKMAESLDMDLLIRSDQSGNLLECIIEMDDRSTGGILEVSPLNMTKWTDKRMLRETDEQQLRQKALHDLMDSPLLSEKKPATSQEASSWIHKYRLNIHYIGNVELFRAFSLLESRLKKNESERWLEEYEELIQTLKSWIQTL